jgi:hypothetical protein
VVGATAFEPVTPSVSANTGNRCARRRSPRSPPTEEAEGKRSCKGLRCLIYTEVPGLHEHPGWSGGGVESRSEVGAQAPSLVQLIATFGLATDAPDEGSGPTLSGRGRLQHLSGSRRQAQPPWDRGRGAPPIGTAGAAGHHCQGGDRMQDR